MQDPKLKLPFQFVGRVDFSPMVIRRSALRYVGGLDEGLSYPGECGIWVSEATQGSVASG